MPNEDHPAESKIESISTPIVNQVPFSLVEKHANKTTKLLANSNRTAPVEGQRRWYQYEFKVPFFITKVKISHNNYQNYHQFQMKAKTVKGTEIEEKSKPDGNVTTFIINEICNSISFRPPKTYFSNRAITSVEIYGFQSYEIEKFFQFANSIESIKVDALADINDKQAKYQAIIERAAKAETEVSNARKELSELKSQADRQRSSIKRLESQRDDLTVKVEAQNARLDTNRSDLETLRSDIESTTKNRNLLNTEVAEKTNELANLRANIDLFPSELDSFVKQGSKNNMVYFWLALVPIIVIGATFVLLVSGAVNLTTLITEKTDVNIEALIASRLPYVFVSLAIITACYKIARAFIVEVMRVNEQRLNLTKISIIAKDVSNASEADLNIDDTTKYHLRLILKMDMLKDHMKGYISNDFRPTVPKSVTSFLPFSGKVGELLSGGKEKQMSAAASLEEGSAAKE